METDLDELMLNWRVYHREISKIIRRRGLRRKMNKQAVFVMEEKEE